MITPDIRAARLAIFDVMEESLIKHLEKTGAINRQPQHQHPNDCIYIGNMMIDLVVLAENLGLNIIDCFAAAATRVLAARAAEEKQ